MYKKILFFLIFICFIPSFGYSDGWFYSKSGGASDTPIFDDGNGFESPWSPVGNPGNWDSFSGTPTSEVTIVAKGSVSMSTDAAEYMVKTLASAQTEIWTDFWYRTSTSSNTHQLLKFNATGGATWVFLSLSTSTLRISDSTNTYDTSITPTTDVYLHFFVHIKLGVDGSEVVQFASNTSDSWDAWDYDNTSATLNTTDMLVINHGRITAGNSSLMYFDGGLRVYAKTSIPDTW